MPRRASAHYDGASGALYYRAQEHHAEVRAAVFGDAIARHVKPEMSVVEFGCAAGRVLERIEAHEKTGVEVNPHSRRAAQERGLHVVERLSELPDESADLVYSSHVLEHTLSPLDELREMRRVLRPGGELVLILPVDDWRAQRDWAVPNVDHHLYTWTPQLIANLLYEAGFHTRKSVIVHRAFPGRFVLRAWRLLPRPFFDALQRVFPYVLRRRDLEAVASKAALDAPE
jgi:SAM-dependent methyltransferase